MQNRKVIFIERFLMPFILSVLMTCVVSLVSILKALGMDGFTFGDWMSAWGWSWVIAYPTLLCVLPFVKRITFFLISRYGNTNKA